MNIKWQILAKISDLYIGVGELINNDVSTQYPKILFYHSSQVKATKFISYLLTLLSSFTITPGKEDLGSGKNNISYSKVVNTLQYISVSPITHVNFLLFLRKRADISESTIPHHIGSIHRKLKSSKILTDIPEERFISIGETNYIDQLSLAIAVTGLLSGFHRYGYYLRLIAIHTLTWLYWLSRRATIAQLLSTLICDTRLFFEKIRYLAEPMQSEYRYLYAYHEGPPTIPKETCLVYRILTKVGREIDLSHFISKISNHLFSNGRDPIYGFLVNRLLRELNTCNEAKNVITLVSEQWSPLLLQILYEKTNADNIVSLYTGTTLFNRLFEEYIRISLQEVEYNEMYKCNVEYIPVSLTDQIFLSIQLKEIIDNNKEKSLIVAYGPSLLVFPLVLYGKRLNIQQVYVI
ncbi:MAG: hypothetical protein DRO40_07090 [Thermoprotei archaeon]|nr:MAG: hypothetical protein DRO40_07090 [Thermoprotei archaeon]